MFQKITFNSEISNLSLAENLVDLISYTNNISEELYGNILISITEAASNAIIHGNALDFNKKVEIVYFIENSILQIVVTDEGNGFDYNNLPDPTSSENLEKIDGRGIFLIKNLADSVSFNQKGNEITIKFIVKSL